MTAPQDAALIVLAAGLSRRFGPANKLLHPLRGQPLAAHIVASAAPLPFRHRLAVLGPDEPALDALFAGAGYTVVRNPHPERGQGVSLAIGVAQAELIAAPAALVCLADMPFVTAGHLLALLAALDASTTADLAATRTGDTLSPPVALLASRMPAFSSLSGDTGGRALLGDAVPVDAAPGLTADFDTPESFGKL